MSLRDIIRAEGKKAFDKHGAARHCTWCFRKGHSSRSCMMMPLVQPHGTEPSSTPLQRTKQEFVLGLLRRKRAPDVDTLRRPEDNGARMPAVILALALGAETNRDSPWAASPKRRDKLRRCLGFWRAIGADVVTTSWIGFGVRLRFEEEPPSVWFPNHKSYREEKEHIEKEHETHVQDGSFRVARDWEVKVGNPVQVDINAKGKRRQCIDMRFPNRYLADYSFTQETL
jgi:hypothetical protein